MTKEEEEELLIKDLGGRLSCGVIIQVYFEDISADGYFDEELWSLELDGESARVNDRWIENIKPYLRPMSSMTQEEKYTYRHMLGATLNSEGESIMFVYVEDFPMVIDWLNAHHFDYRGLIEKGLALEAPENMYK